MRVLLALLLLVAGLSGCAVDDYGYVYEDGCRDDRVYHYEYVESYYPPYDEHCERDAFYEIYD